MKLKHFLLVGLLLCSTSVARAQMSAHFINVGQAESILLEFTTAAVLIDAGGEATGDKQDSDHLDAYLKRSLHVELTSTAHSQWLLAVILT